MNTTNDFRLQLDNFYNTWQAIPGPISRELIDDLLDYCSEHYRRLHALGDARTLTEDDDYKEVIDILLDFHVDLNTLQQELTIYSNLFDN